MIEQIGLWLLVVATLAGAYPILKPYRALKLSRRMARIAQSALSAAEQRGKQNEPQFVEFYNSASKLSLCVPLIASGVLRNPLNRRPGAEDERAVQATKEYIDSNSWLMPYLMAGSCCFVVSCSLGHPLSMSHWKRYFLCRTLLLLVSRPDGGILAIPTEKELREYVQAQKSHSDSVRKVKRNLHRPLPA